MKNKLIQILVAGLLLMTVLTGCNKDQNATTISSENTVQGTWQTASMGNEYYGTLQPEYYVQFTNSEIIYGHMKNGEFVQDHSDRIIRLEKIAPDKFMIQAESSNGTHYTYLTCESDPDALEYYGTWSEKDFPETYSISSSLGRCS